MRSLKIKANDISFIAMFVAFLCATNGNLLNTSNVIIYYLPYVLCLGAYLLEILPKERLVLSSYLVWRICVLVIMVISMFYAIEFSDAMVSVKRYILQTFVTALICKKCFDHFDNAVKIVKISIVAIILSLTYAFSTVDIAALEMGQRLGVSTINEAWNANSIGSMAAVGIVFTIFVFLFHCEKPSAKDKVIVGTLIFAFSLMMILSGSRKSILLVGVTLLYYIMFSSKSHIVRNVIVACLLIVLMFYLLYNVPFLYDNIGYRFESLFSMFEGSGGDKSSLARQEMINVGVDAFWEKPLFGYGINSFKEIYGLAMGRTVYAHNNYIELLVDVGLVGFCIYYVYLAGIFLLTKTKNDKKYIYLKALLLALLVADVGTVSYYDGFIQYVLCIVLVVLISSQRNPKMQIKPQVIEVDTK